MRIYVAGKYEDAAKVKAVQAGLRADGHEVVADWTDHNSDGMAGAGLVDYLRGCAEADADGLRQADAIVLLHHDHCRGAFVELGIALGLGKLAVVIGGKEAAPKLGPIFYFLPQVHHFETAEAARSWIRWTETAYAKPRDAAPGPAPAASLEDL